jgi:small subunit ribosomal protein S17e
MLGRISGKWVKKMAFNLIEIYPDKFNKDFENNKKFLLELGIFDDKVVRNKLAGFITSSVQEENN